MSSREVLILCGGAQLPRRERAWAAAERVTLDAPLSGGNVTLRIADITRPICADLPDVAVDLLELATYVYAADQAVRRGGKAELEYGGRWRRHFRLQVPVRRPDIWADSAVQSELSRTLSFLSDDEFEFHFVHGTTLPKFAEYLPNMAPASGRADAFDSVMLFSGGLDSLAGAVDEILLQKRRVALVSHRPVGKLDHRQRDLMSQLSQHVTSGAQQPLHISVWANKEKGLGREYTQRTRSFLFGAFGVGVATLLGLDTVRFYENGVVSLNLPVCAQVLGGRASRTTHPQVLYRMQALFSRVLERQIRIENPYLTKTKTDVVSFLQDAGYANLIPHSVSCAHTWETTKAQPHCGRCSQCIDRKLATVAAGLPPEFDPDSGYQVPVLSGEFKGVEHQTMVERVIGMSLRARDIQYPARFFTEYGEASRALRYMNVSADQAAASVWSLYRRHAEQVRRAVATAATCFSANDTPPVPNNTLIGISGQSLSGRAADGEAAEVRMIVEVLGEPDLVILDALSHEAVPIQQVTLEATINVSRRSIGKRLFNLRRYCLIEYPHGPRKGVRLSSIGHKAALEGRTTLERRRAARERAGTTAASH